MELRSDKGHIVRLLKPLTRPGGEGQVFAIEDSSTMVAKLYHQPAVAQKAAKLRWQVQAARPELRSIAAWPTDLLLEPKSPSTVRGITMPRMAGKEIHQLYGPAARAVEFPSAGWDFLIHVAMNCAAAFDTLHQEGIVMADVNEGNLLVSERDGRVSLIDCDSYQVRNGSGYFLCDVGIPMWTPPELQGRDFRGLERIPNHDRFGLAVIIFRLLFMGRHPFAGVPTGANQFEIEEAIKKFLFAFSPQTWVQGVRAPPFTIGLKQIPGGLAALFERAFLSGSAGPNARPTGREWALELKALLSALKKGCVDPGHKYWNGLTSCPWCEIANSGGPNFFISVTINLGSASLNDDCAAFWATIERVLHGALMSEQVALPTIGPATGRAMPFGKPQAPTLSAPVAPSKPTPPPKPVVLAPVLPKKPVMSAPARLPTIPLGPSERVARVCFLGACFFALGTVFCFNLGISEASMGAGWGALVCIVVAFVKFDRARVERRKRKEADRVARAEERRLAASEHAKRITDYEAEVKKVRNRHEAEVSQAEAEYKREWFRRDEEYQRVLNCYLEDKRIYDQAQRQYVEEVNAWNSEVEKRTNQEDACRRGVMDTAQRLQGLLKSYQGEVNALFRALEAAKQRFEKAKADELVDMKKLHQKREELQKQQFLASQLIEHADIPNIGSGRKATLSAHNIETAGDIRSDMRVPGFGASLISNLMAWRRQCEARFKYNASMPLPVAEVNKVKLKYASARHSALAELRGGSAKLDDLEKSTRAAVSQEKLVLLKLAREHAQALADLNASG